MNGLILLLSLLQFSQCAQLCSEAQGDCCSGFGLGSPFPESRFDTVDGISLHYRYWDVPLSELRGSVLFVHGFGASTFSWRRNVDALVKEGYRVLAVDLPAYGYSDRKRGLDHSHAARAALLWRLLDDVDMSFGPPCRPIRWVLVGHSMGGGAVAAMALQRPERTGGLVLVDAAIYVHTLRTNQFLLRVRPVRALFEAAARTFLLQRRTVAYVVADVSGRPADSASVDGYYAPLRIEGTAEAIVDGLLTGGRNRQLATTKVKAPTLIIWGDNDTWVPLADGERLAKEIPDSRLVTVTDGGHQPMENEPGVFNSLLLNFLRNLK